MTEQEASFGEFMCRRIGKRAPSSGHNAKRTKSGSTEADRNRQAAHVHPKALASWRLPPSHACILIDGSSLWRWPGCSCGWGAAGIRLNRFSLGLPGVFTHRGVLGWHFFRLALDALLAPRGRRFTHGIRHLRSHLRLEACRPILIVVGVGASDENFPHFACGYFRRAKARPPA